MLLSGRKIAQGDLLEQTRLIYSVSPRKFQTWAAMQGYSLTSLQEAEELARQVSLGNIKDFNLKKLLKEIPLSAKEISSARKSIRVV